MCRVRLASLLLPLLLAVPRCFAVPSLPAVPSAWRRGVISPDLPWTGCTLANRSACPRLDALWYQSFWPLTRLSNALTSTQTTEAWLPLLAKLRDGKPIVVLGFGSSIMEEGGGCYASFRALRRAGVMKGGRRQEMFMHETGACNAAGYIALFLDTINASFPHPDHVFVNVGKAASSLGSAANLECIDSKLPVSAGADLIIMETHASREGGTPRDVELLYRTVAHRTHQMDAPPPLVLLSWIPVIVDFESDKRDSYTQNGTCMTSQGTDCGSCVEKMESIASVVANIDTFLAAEAKLVALARRYGWAHLSYHDALAAGLRDGVHTKLGWSVCEWLNAFVHDELHPSPAGAWLVADALLRLLLSAQTLADAEPSLLTPPSLALSIGWPPGAPFNRGAWDAAGNGSRACFEPEDLRPALGAAASNWTLVQHEIVKGNIVFKPGWLANTTGAALELPVRTVLHGVRERSDRVRLVLRYLTSYEHMGSVDVACVKGCDCRPLIVDGHTDARVSVEHDASTEVTQADECTLRFTVRAETQSGEHKFKILGFAVTPL